MPRIKIPTPLRRFADDESQIEVDASTVGEALERLTQRHDALRTHLYDDNGTLRNFVNVYVNKEDVRTLQSEKTPVQKDDEIVIVPSIAGGTA